MDANGKDEIHFHFASTVVKGAVGEALSGKTHGWVEIIKANGPDKFFVHSKVTEVRLPTNYSRGGTSTFEKTTQFFPFYPSSRSGITSEAVPFLGPLVPARKDRDYVTLLKLVNSFPEVEKYVQSRKPWQTVPFDAQNWSEVPHDRKAYVAVSNITRGAEFTANVLMIVDGGLAGLSKGSASTFAVASSAGGQSAPMLVVRLIKKGEKIEDLMNEAKALTWTSGNEHALVTLKNGERALVSGGPAGITFEAGQIKTLFGHTHPTSAPPSSTDFEALERLGQSKQYVLHGGEVTTVRAK